MLLLLRSPQHFWSPTAAQLWHGLKCPLLQGTSGWQHSPKPTEPEHKQGCTSQQLIITWFQRSFPYFIWLSWSLAYWKDKANLTIVGRSSHFLNSSPCISLSSCMAWQVWARVPTAMWLKREIGIHIYIHIHASLAVSYVLGQFSWILEAFFG